MLAPKKMKHRKSMRGKIKGRAAKGADLAFGTVG